MAKKKATIRKFENCDGTLLEIELLGVEYSIHTTKQDGKKSSIHKVAANEESAVSFTEKLIESKLKNGFKEIIKANNKKSGWFENLTQRLFIAYKNEILRHQTENYVYLCLKYNGGKFALGLTTNPTDNYWEYISDSVWDYGEESVESLYLNEKKNTNEVNRTEWPLNSNDCFEFERHLVSVALGITFLLLKEDNDLGKYLKNLKNVVIDANDKQLTSFKEFPKKEVRIKAVKKFVADNQYTDIILDLWADELKAEGANFLRNLGINLNEQRYVSEDVIKNTFKKAQQLYDGNKGKQAIKTLLPVAERLANSAGEQDKNMVEKCCGLLGLCFKETNNFDASEEWFKKGIAAVPWGYSILNLFALYSYKTQNYTALIHVAEKHLIHSTKNDKNFTFHFLNYMANAYMHLEMLKEGDELYRKIYKQFGEDKEKREMVLDKLNNIPNEPKEIVDLIQLFSA